MKPKLLVVDDEPDVLDMIRGYFEPRGFEVHTAPDGKLAIEICRQIIPDIILLDLKMKEMDGDEAVPYLRRAAPQAKIFIVSAYQDDLMETRIAALGVDAYFEKPVSILVLQEAILKAIGPL